MQYRVGVLGRRKLRNRIKYRDQAIQQMNELIIQLQGEVSTLEGQVSQLQGQITQLQSDLADAQALAQLRANIINYKNNYIQELQTILDNNGIPYPPEPVYPT